MRVSVDKNDKGYVEDSWAYQPYLNGEKVSFCITADEEEGIVLVEEYDENGKVVLDERCENIRTKILRGEVKIIRNDHQ